MSEEFCLSDHLEVMQIFQEKINYIELKNVKEFIKILKEEIKNYCIDSDIFNLKAHSDVQKIINKLAGEIRNE